jgi:hypothetical protein
MSVSSDKFILRLPTTFCVYLVAGVGGLKNGAQRNVKPDQHRPCPTTPDEIKK